MTVRQRIVAGTAAQLSWQAVDQDGEPSDPGLTTVKVLASDGSTVHAAGTATTSSGAVRYVAVPAQDVDELTATWTGATATGETTVDVVGGVYFTVAQLRAAQPAVVNTVDFPSATIVASRQDVETLFEQRLGVAFVPRLKVFTTTRRAEVAQTGIRSVLWVELSDDTMVTDAATIVDYVEVHQGGVRCTSGVDRVGVVVGSDRPPADVRRVAMLYARHLLTAGASGIDMRTLAGSGVDDQVSAYPTPGKPWFVTGIDEIDEVLRAYRHKAGPRSVRVGWLL